MALGQVLDLLPFYSVPFSCLFIFIEYQLLARDTLPGIVNSEVGKAQSFPQGSKGKERHCQVGTPVKYLGATVLWRAVKPQKYLIISNHTS